MSSMKHEACTHYIGRITSYDATKHGTYTGLGNPFGFKRGPGFSHEKSRHDVIIAFEQLVRHEPELVAKIHALPKDAVLGCWCKPAACHGDVIVKIWKEIHNVHSQ